jgi:hypothetical protein
MTDAYVHRGELHADAAVYLDAAYVDWRDCGQPVRRLYVGFVIV